MNRTCLPQGVLPIALHGRPGAPVCPAPGRPEANGCPQDNPPPPDSRRARTEFPWLDARYPSDKDPSKCRRLLSRCSRLGRSTAYHVIRSDSNRSCVVSCVSALGMRASRLCWRPHLVRSSVSACCCNHIPCCRKTRGVPDDQLVLARRLGTGMGVEVFSR